MKRKYAFQSKGITLFMITVSSYSWGIMESGDNSEILRYLYETRQITLNIGTDFTVLLVEENVTDYLSPF